MTAKPNFSNLIPKFDDILSRGLCVGVGDRDGQMCIEAAICAAMDLPHGDEPDCVAKSVRSYKITLNDSSWSSAAARARGLRNLGIAQIGSRGVVDDQEFAKRLAEQTIRELIPTLFREVFPDRQECLDAADRCASEGTTASADSAASTAASPEVEASSFTAWFNRPSPCHRHPTNRWSEAPRHALRTTTTCRGYFPVPGRR